ncbi:lipopolysaccharide biosynthesis protein [Leifsonia shinshuensis]|uniref:lipopolysaccharide biosynthesis protein n=1 Tax=Leifsonia shinshuensis TaxID=150026 RepID=UPI001F504CBC|nr:lipopolysaccharide biosynthesis protein [Leifsonia shinshuensis]MCI0158212.1 lipopolysaccharide biosynthesis protein [Leifsonia shinshuensis]
MSEEPSAAGSDAGRLSLARRGALSTGSVAAQGLLRFLYSLIVGRLLGPAALGVVNSSIALAQFLSLAAPAGLGSAATTFIARTNGAGSHALAVGITAFLARMTLLTGAVLSLIAAGLTAFVFDPGDWLEPVLVALLTFALSAYSFVRGVYFAHGRMDRALFWDIVTSVSGLLLLVGVIVLDWSALLLLPLAITYGVYAIAGWPRGGRLGERVPSGLRHEIIAFIGWTSLAALTTGGFLQLSMVIARAIGTAQAAGEYAAALSLATPATMIGSILSITMMPTMAHAVGRDDRDSLRKQADLTTRTLALLLGLAFGCLIVASRPLIAVLFGSRFQGADAILPILMAASFVQSVNVGAVTALVTSHRSTVRVPSLLSLAGVVVGLGVMAALVPTLSVTGVAIGFLVSAVISGLGPILVVWRAHRMQWTGLFVRIACGVVLVGVLLVVTREWIGGYWADVVLALGFAAAWLVIMLPELRILRRSIAA